MMTQSPNDDGMLPEDTMGGRIVAAREATGHSTAQLARRLGVKTATLQNWENDRSEPRSNKLTMLAGLLGVTPGWLLTGNGTSPIDGIEDHRHDVASVRERLIELRRQSESLTEQIDALVNALN